MRTYKVYAKADDQGKITDINSSAHLRDTDGWTLIDEGTGDRYYHAQGNYFDKPLTDDAERRNYKLVKGKPKERTEKEKSADEVQDKTAGLADEINAATTLDELKAALTGQHGIARKARA